MEEPVQSRFRLKKRLLFFLKLVVTAACLWYVSTKIDLEAAGVALGKANWIWLAAAVMLYILSKIVSALRLNINFRNTGLHLPEKLNLELYWLGMYYNLFLPGSITGDAYKVIALGRKYKISYRKLTSAVLLDRFSGLAGLGVLLAAYGMLSLHETWMKPALPALAILAVFILYFMIKKWLKDFLPGFIQTLLLGIVVQAIQVLAIYMILFSFGIDGDHQAYIFLFLLSSIASVLPLTIGGLGIREIVFLYGAPYFGLQTENAILVSLVFFLVTVVSSAGGLWFVFRDPLQNKDADPHV